jgi:menaquinone-specific isochorismate synthase
VVSGLGGPDPRQRLYAARLVPDRAGAAFFRRAASESGVVLLHDGRAILASGTAGSLPLPAGLAEPDAAARAERALAEIEVLHDGAPAQAAAPLAIGALPFDRTRSAALRIPAATLVEEAAGSVVILVASEKDDLMQAVSAWEAGGLAVGPDDRPAGGPPERFGLSSSRSHEEFRHLVREAVSDIRAGLFEKVVLVREVMVEADRAFHPSSLVERLRALYPSCATFSIDGFVGASPELLVARRGASVSAHPLAGTIGRSGDPATDARAEAEFLASAKERSEHRVVVEAIAAVLGPLCETLAVPDAPSIVELRNVSHLGSFLTGRLSPSSDAGGGLPGALDLVARLHPTPAVAGTPTEDALTWIAKHEELDRGPYAGPVGWVDARGDGEWFVGIRAGLFDGRQARLFAGVGVVADSDPDAELAETQLKLQALLAAAVRP